MEYSIEQVSKCTNLPSHTLRYYEKEGLLPSIKRSKGGMRRFSQGDLDWLGLICCLKNTGMPIKQIKEFVELSADGSTTLKKRCELLILHKNNVEEQIETMEKHLQEVTMKIKCYTEQYEMTKG